MSRYIIVMDHYDAIVLGAGGVGSAALFHVARRGARVLGIDRFGPPHDRGSSHGQTRVIRQAYFEHPDYVPLLLDSYRLWHELETRTRRHLLHEIGVVQIGPADGVVVPGVLRAADEHALAVERISAAEVEARWPGLRAGADLEAVYEPAAGYLLVEDCVRAHLEAAREAGADVLVNTESLAWRSDGQVIRLGTNIGEFSTDRLIITAGAWASPTLADLGIVFTVLRKSLFWFAAEAAEYEVSKGFPVFLFELPHGIFYGFPKLDPRGVKFAEHSGGIVVDDPLLVDRVINAEEQRRLLEVLPSHLPGVSTRITDHSVCLYTMSPDEHFIVGRHPRHANVVFAAGLSGHGFKFAPVLGRTLAELALDGGTERQIDFLSLKRFSI